MFYNETLYIVSSSDNNKKYDSCIVYIVLFFCVFNNKYIYSYLYLFLFLFKK